jgi:hypothetical protein
MRETIGSIDERGRSQQWLTRGKGWSLSLDSIVVREYVIPVVPGISLATPRIRSG